MSENVEFKEYTFKYSFFLGDISSQVQGTQISIKNGKVH